ncbi:MAG: ATP-binding cassette domain-containing protein [Verrucomicrobia bacterium]|nr:ATP-binding cassette domain-containing protein [Verrucomicrobiota bacterium]
MIEVSDLTKRYGGQTAVAGVSFRVQKGEIVGLLGPNGAGKSTILRILSCYLPATIGTARVAGFDVFDECDEVKKRIGYMPENNPLHPDMRVREYLTFRARLKGLSASRARERVGVVMDQCRLAEVGRRIVGQLSKGYRQRVGLADALVHQPELLILDEPTIGLDPYQVRAVRQLIKELGRTHTILVSTHVLPEVEMTCSRILILHEGRLLAADSKENLQKRLSQEEKVVAEIAAPLPELQECWKEMELIEHFDISPADGEYYRCALTARAGVDIRSLVFEQARLHGWTLRELTRGSHTLEDIFVHIIRGDQEETF